jgi:ubiquinone/menaquinone biosynthesis C-methylase UbiE
MKFDNVYEDNNRAKSYAELEFPGTYNLAYRDIPEIITKYVNGKKALDFGCGAGRSTRYLKQLGFNTIGLDISKDMLKLARERDPNGEYFLIRDTDLSRLKDNSYDLVFSAFTFDNIPTEDKKIQNLGEIRRVLKTGGIFINLVSSPEIYMHEWASFTTKAFPENRTAKSGDKVKIIMTDVSDRRPIEDIIWFDDAYRNIYGYAEFRLLKVHKPLGKKSEPHVWINETKIAPWVIYVLSK